MRSAATTENTRQAVLAIVTAVFALSLGDALIKANIASMPLWQMFILRSALLAPVLWWLVRRNGGTVLKLSRWVLLRSVLLSLMWLSYYVAISLMPLAVAAATYYTSPLIIVALAAFVAKKWPPVLALVAISAGFFGVILVIQPDVTDLQYATLLPLLSAVFYACAMVITAEKCRDEDPFLLAFGMNTALIIAGFGLGLFSGRGGFPNFGTWQPIDLALSGTVLVLALLVLIGSVCAAVAYQKGPPATVAAFDYSFLVFSILWGVVFFSEIPGFWACIGIAFIIGAGMLALLSQKDRNADL